MFFNDKIRKKLKEAIRKAIYPIPKRLSDKHISINAEGLFLIEEALNKSYFKNKFAGDNKLEEKHSSALEAHLSGRLEYDRRMIVPWLDSVTRLENKRILEIGCGTGSSTIALAEQGSKVTGIDIDEGALEVAKERVNVYGLDSELFYMNARQISGNYAPNDFDIIIYFASLEHMTIGERLDSINGAWDILPVGGLLVVIETPNRLWYHDHHTSMLPFFHWLPNELAFAYSQFSPREDFNTLYRCYNLKDKEHFLRWGRGLSFHEFDLAIGVNSYKVISSLSSYEGIKYKLRKTNKERRFKSFLMSINPDLHQGFFDDHIYIIICKNKKSEVN